MRRKTAPFPLRACGGAPRALTPATSSTPLPTAAALAFALLAAGCSAPVLDSIGADPVRATPAASAPAPAPSPSAVPSIMPDPHEIEGGIGVVMPVAPRPKLGAVKPAKTPMVAAKL